MLKSETAITIDVGYDGDPETGLDLVFTIRDERHEGATAKLWVSSETGETTRTSFDGSPGALAAFARRLDRYRQLAVAEAEYQNAIWAALHDGGRLPEEESFLGPAKGRLERVIERKQRDDVYADALRIAPRVIELRGGRGKPAATLENKIVAAEFFDGDAVKAHRRIRKCFELELV